MAQPVDAMFEEVRPFLLALAIGLLIGIERERSRNENESSRPFGPRTFALLGFMGAAAAQINQTVVVAAISFFVVAFVLAVFMKAPITGGEAKIGVTTEVAAMVTFVLGFLSVTRMALAVLLGVVTLVLLALKPTIRAFVKAGIKQKEWSAALTFMVIAFVVLPLLPDRPVDPWDLVNPARLWLILVLMTGISFAGYILVRILGPRWGVTASGLFGGLVSSTAVTLTLSHIARKDDTVRGSVATGIVLANVSSAASQMIVIALAFAPLVDPVGRILGATVLTGIGATLAAMLLPGMQKESEPLEIESPLALRSSIKFTGVLAIVFVVASLASRLLGVSGVLGTAVLGGAASVHAVSLAMATLAGSGDLSIAMAALAILVGFLANMAVKLVLVAWAGGLRLFVLVAPPFLAMIGSAIAAYIWLVR